MTILSDALTRAEAAEREATELRRSLLSVRAELLELERLGGATTAGLVVADRVDDMRRYLCGPLHSITVSVRAALHGAETAYSDGSVSGVINAAHGRTMVDVVLQSTREICHLQLALSDTVEALSDICGELPGDARKPRLLSRSLQHASTSLERAQRGAHRVSEDLSMITRSLSVDVAGLIGDRVEAGSGVPPVDRHAIGADPVRQAVVNAEDLRRGLAADLADLVEIESLVRREGISLLIVDRAEDLRRSLTDTRRDHAQGLRRAIHQAETLLLENATNRDIESGTARSMTAMALQAAKEVRHLQLDLGHCADSITHLAQSSPSGELTDEASKGLVAAITGLDRARRSASRVAEDLPILARSIARTPERPVALALVLSEQVERLALAQTGPRPRESANSASPVVRGMGPVGFNR